MRAGSLLEGATWRHQAGAGGASQVALPGHKACGTAIGDGPVQPCEITKWLLFEPLVCHMAIGKEQRRHCNGLI